MSIDRVPEIQPIHLRVEEYWRWDGRVLDARAPNIIAGTLGDVARIAGNPIRKDVGDSIDRGLILLRVLREAGFEVRLTPKGTQDHG